MLTCWRNCLQEILACLWPNVVRQRHLRLWLSSRWQLHDSRQTRLLMMHGWSLNSSTTPRFCWRQCRTCFGGRSWLERCRQRGHKLYSTCCRKQRKQPIAVVSLLCNTFAYLMLGGLEATLEWQFLVALCGCVSNTCCQGVIHDSILEVQPVMDKQNHIIMQSTKSYDESKGYRLWNFPSLCGVFASYDQTHNESIIQGLNQRSYDSYGLSCLPAAFLECMSPSHIPGAAMKPWWEIVCKQHWDIRWNTERTGRRGWHFLTCSTTSPWPKASRCPFIFLVCCCAQNGPATRRPGIFFSPRPCFLQKICSIIHWSASVATSFQSHQCFIWGKIFQFACPIHCWTSHGYCSKRLPTQHSTYPTFLRETHQKSLFCSLQAGSEYSYCFFLLHGLNPFAGERRKHQRWRVSGTSFSCFSADKIWLSYLISNSCKHIVTYLKYFESESESEVRMPKRQPSLGREPGQKLRNHFAEWSCKVLLVVMLCFSAMFCSVRSFFKTSIAMKYATREQEVRVKWS